MKIRVIHQDGQQEVLTIVGPLSVIETNLENGMSHFRDAIGRDYWFNDSDGTYDGWGQGGSFTEKEMDATVEQVQGGREMVEPIERKP